jgi:hypothetical protein
LPATTNRYCKIKGNDQGNFGGSEGDEAKKPRFLEMRFYKFHLIFSFFYLYYKRKAVPCLCLRRARALEREECK